MIYRVVRLNVSAFPNRVVTVDIPAYAEFASAEGANVSATAATWEVNVEPGSPSTLVATVHVGDIPEGAYRVTTTASVYSVADGVSNLLIRSADSDTIPGVVDPAVTNSPSEDAQPPSGVSPLGVVAIIGAALLVVIALFLVVWRRQKAARAQPVDDGTHATTREVAADGGDSTGSPQ